MVIISDNTRFIFLLCHFWACYGQKASKSAPNIDGYKLEAKVTSAGSHNVSDEDEHAKFMPQYLRCDACKAIASRYTAVLQKESNKTKSIRAGKMKISEARLIEIFEEICGDKHWTDDYGLKDIDGVKHLHYPESEFYQTPGVTRIKGRWPKRFSIMCYNYVDLHDEQEIYSAYLEERKKGIIDLLCISDCKSSKKLPLSEL